MRKPIPFELELSIPDGQFLQDSINNLLLEIVRYTLESTSAPYEDRLAYINKIIQLIDNN
jgi:hypothetical protein